MYLKVMYFCAMLVVIFTLWSVSVLAMPSLGHPQRFYDDELQTKQTKIPILAKTKRPDTEDTEFSCVVTGHPPEMCELCGKHTGSRKAYIECCRGSPQILEFCRDFLFYKFNPRHLKR